jgi:hypothetical protein
MPSPAGQAGCFEDFLIMRRPSKNCKEHLRENSSLFERHHVRSGSCVTKRGRFKWLRATLSEMKVGFGDQVADPKPPQAALVKSQGGERCGKVGTMIPAGTVERGERKRTVDEVSKAD